MSWAANKEHAKKRLRIFFSTKEVEKKVVRANRYKLLKQLGQKALLEHVGSSHVKSTSLSLLLNCIWARETYV